MTGTVGMVGLGRIGRGDHAPPRRHEGGRSSITPAPSSPMSPTAITPASSTWRTDVDVLLVITPGGAATRNPDQCRGARSTRPQRHPHQSVPRIGGGRAGLDQGPARKTRFSAPAWTCSSKEPHVPKELIEMEHVVLFPACRLRLDPYAAGDGAARGSTTCWPGRPASRRSRRLPETPWPPEAARDAVRLCRDHRDRCAADRRRPGAGRSSRRRAMPPRPWSARGNYRTPIAIARAPSRFKLGTATGGYPIDLDKGCGEAFPAIRTVAAWTIGKK